MAAQVTASKKAERERRKLESTAYHEAGHAVACIELGRPFKSVTIVPGDGTRGQITMTPVPAWLMPDVDRSPRATRWIEREISYLLAGLAAEHRFASRNNWLGAHDDISNARELASFLYPFGSPVLKKYLAFMEELARMFVSVDKNWRRIEKLAAALIEHRTLSARESKELCRLALSEAVPGLR
jgi:ATP-dependent Zn protease